MTTLEEMLERALLAGAHYTDEEMRAAERRLSGRLASCREGGTHLGTGRCTGAGSPSKMGSAGMGLSESAGQSLAALCQAVLRAHGSLPTLHQFVSDSMPDPAAARVLGCVLSLAGAEDSAMFWWRYAAGAGDHMASYCLYLQHLSFGEPGEAEIWVTSRTDNAQVSLALRVLRLLRDKFGDDGAVPERLTPLLIYIPASLSFVDDEDVELPLPDPDFVDHIESLTRSYERAFRATHRYPPLPGRCAHSRGGAASHGGRRQQKV
ncbi:hypothetical protein [Streptomyces otsuchiensis]|uniref:hypothetical protein n=1 Tax=Streptomyces otsuchiensis TaxID=2681388 RepID=UPI00102FDF85|nr:hypothetical protein [Streptomyces otsuchiensis]